MTAEAKSCELLTGTIERTVYHHQDTGFSVLRLKAKGHRDLVTVVCHAAPLGAGEIISCSGLWVKNRDYGLQFQANTLECLLPQSLEGIQKYLASGMIKGIGPHFAKELLACFGARIFEVLDLEPQRLLEVEGIGEKRQQLILAAWHEQKAVRDLMVFLQSYGMGTARALRIHKQYGKQAIEKIRANPYCLAADIWGIGFKTADQLALKLGVEKDSLLRAQSGVNHVVHELCDRGHCAASLEKLRESAVKLLEISQDLVCEALENEKQAGNLVEDLIKEQACIYPISLYKAETNAAKNLLLLLKGTPPWRSISILNAISWVEQKTQLTLSNSQREALELVFSAKVSIITGGPGVGKTTLLNSLLILLKEQQLKIALTAPTGRAAKRLSEATGFEAQTLHRLLSLDPSSYSFKYDRKNPLPYEVVVIDESSMLDIALLNAFLRALPMDAAVIFVGDIDQLPSVGPGAVLADLINSKVIPTARLSQVFRQAEDSQIIVNAHRVNQGLLPLPNIKSGSDFYTLYLEDPQAIHEELLNLVVKRLPEYYHCDPLKHIQVLTPMNRGLLGTQSLNVSLQERLNADAKLKITRYGTSFSPGDRVIQLKNNYNKEVFNGDIGTIEELNLDEGLVLIRFDHNLKEYELNELDELSLAYAISIHKSQGSEFPIVVIPITTQHYTMLAKNLVYTAMTRARKLVVLVAQKKALAIAVKQEKTLERLTKLGERLKCGLELGNRYE